MTETPRRTADTTSIVAYDPIWSQVYATEQALVLSIASPPMVAIEQIGSTAVPGLCAKPIVDMMAAVPNLQDSMAFFPQLAMLEYHLIRVPEVQLCFSCSKAGLAL